MCLPFVTSQLAEALQQNQRKLELAKAASGSLRMQQRACADERCHEITNYMRGLVEEEAGRNARLEVKLYIVAVDEASLLAAVIVMRAIPSRHSMPLASMIMVYNAAHAACIITRR